MNKFWLSFPSGFRLVDDYVVSHVRWGQRGSGLFSLHFASLIHDPTH